MRAMAVIAAWLLCWGVARADTIDDNMHQLADASYKVRLAAALALAKSRDPRAVIALAEASKHDSEATIRRVAVLALGKMIDERTAPDAMSLGLAAVDQVAAGDRDANVRSSAERVKQELAPLRNKKRDEPVQHGPEVFVHIPSATDPSKLAPSDAGERLARVVSHAIDRTGYATSWPGGLPTHHDLTGSHSRGFIVASTVKAIELSHKSRGTQVVCKLEIRVAPWSGTDGGETWEANKAAAASGSATAMTGSSDREIASGIHDCLEAVAEDVTNRQIVPFLRRLAAAGS